MIEGKTVTLASRDARATLGVEMQSQTVISVIEGTLRLENIDLFSQFDSDSPGDGALIVGRNSNLEFKNCQLICSDTRPCIDSTKTTTRLTDSSLYSMKTSVIARLHPDIGSELSIENSTLIGEKAIYVEGPGKMEFDFQRATLLSKSAIQLDALSLEETEIDFQARRCLFFTPTSLLWVEANGQTEFSDEETLLDQIELSFVENYLPESFVHVSGPGNVLLAEIETIEVGIPRQKFRLLDEEDFEELDLEEIPELIEENEFEFLGEFSANFSVVGARHD